MSLAFLAAPLLGALPLQGFDLPPGFELARVSDLAESFLALGFAPDGRLLLGVEDGPILWARDADGDGVYEAHGTFTAELASCQGLAWMQGGMWATARRAGHDGLFRIVASADGASAEKIETVLSITAGGEHGVHGVVVGPDGFLYLAIGDHASIESPHGASLVLEDGYEGHLLPEYPDPNGHGLRCKYPHGIVARVDPKDGSWTRHAVGFRNFCDVAFDARGDLFTVDSDMEWDLGLPWYRPVRVLHVIAGGDYGSRRGSSVWPSWYPDSLPSVVDVGRGSPTGLLVCTDARFPASFAGALLVADWSQGRILAVHLAPAGASFSGSIETLLAAKGACPITDLAFGKDGALYFTTGGRGVVGEVMRLAYRGASAPAKPAVEAPRVEPSLASPDRFARWAARAALEHAPPADLLARALADEDPASFLESALAVARVRAAGTSPDALIEKLVRLLDDASRRPETLRVIEVVLLRLGEPSGEARARLLERAAVLFSKSDRRSAREIAVLLARLAPAKAIGPLLAAMNAETEREQAIHYAYCLASVEHGFTADTARAFLRWFETARAWTGGSSFAGYLAAMRESLLSHLGPAEIAGVAAAEDTGVRTLAFVVAREDATEPPELAAALERKLATLPDAPESDAARLDVVRTLAGAHGASALAILRDACLGSPAVRDAALSALADSALPDDTARFVAGLANPSPDIPGRCARALAKLGWRPETPGAIAATLDAALRMGSSRARPLLDILRRCADLPPLPEGTSSIPARTEEFTRSIEALEAWLRARHPELHREQAGVGLGPRWGADRILAFLARSSARPGSPARGRDAFTRATCSRCHVLQGDTAPHAADPQGFQGPDLTTAARRFDDAALLEAILSPSRAVSDQYRNTVVVTDEEERVEGRVVVEDPSSLTLLLADGERRRIERTHVASTRPSEISPMPEGLLAASTLEEVKDLFAYLRAGGHVETSDASGAPWIRMLEGPQRKGWNFDPAVWKAPEGVLVGKGANLPRSSYFLSKAVHADFEFEFDVRMQAGNSGFQYRSLVDPSTPDPIGYQADIGQGYWGSLYISDGRGIAAQADPKLWVPVLDREGWNHFFVHVEGDHHVIELNGLVTTDFHDAVFSTGVLGFQVHQGLVMEVRCANVRMRELR